MPCDYHFWNGAHTHCVCAGYELEFVLCRGLVGRACVSVVNAFLKVDSYSCGDFLGQFSQLWVIRSGHIRESRAKLFHILTYQRVRKHIDMVLNHHQVAHLVARVQSSCCVRHEQGLYPQHFHNPHRESDLLHSIAFVEVEASLHRQNAVPGYGAADQVPLMANRGADREVRNLFIRKNYRFFYGIGQCAQPASQHDSDAGLSLANSFFYKSCRCLIITKIHLSLLFLFRNRVPGIL